MKQQLLHGAKVLGKRIRKNSPLLLTIGTVLGVGTVIFTTAKSTIKAKEDLDNLKFDAEEEGFDVSKKEVAKILVKDCWPVALATGATVTMTLSNHKINTNRLHTATVAYEFYKEAYETYKANVREKFGDEVDRATEVEVAKKKHKKTYDPSLTKDTGTGNILFIESKSGQTLRASVDHIRECEKYFNNMIRGEDWLAFNNWLITLGLRPMDEDFGDLLGFREIYDKDALNIKLTPSNEVFDTGETATLISYVDSLCTEDDRTCLGY